MQIDSDKVIEDALRHAFRDGIASKLTGYNSPLDKMIQAAFEVHTSALRAILEDSIASCVKDTAFKEHIATAVRSQLAKLLVQRFGGELEKQVNVLKSDPTTRARITLAIEEIVKQKAT